ncbi:hypothetical protein OG21DRAFT_1511249 [Imleria badia]|nr:hypothetical protein OG21DRAFT_1511249 [Imleria badia]
MSLTPFQIRSLPLFNQPLQRMPWTPVVVEHFAPSTKDLRSFPHSWIYLFYFSISLTCVHSYASLRPCDAIDPF